MASAVWVLPSLRIGTGGHEVSVWNRSSEPLRMLEGVTVLETPADAFARHHVVITILSDDNAVRSVILDSGALASARPGVVHVVMSTISAALVAHMQPPHEQAGVAYVAAPVFSVPAVAAHCGRWCAPPIRSPTPPVARPSPVATLAPQQSRLQCRLWCWLAGDSDTATPPERVEAMARAIPGLREFVLLRDAAHIPMAQHPGAVSEA